MSAVIGWGWNGWDGDDYHVFMIHDMKGGGIKNVYEWFKCDWGMVGVRGWC